MNGSITRRLLPVLPLALLTLIWMSLVYAEVRLGKTFAGADSPVLVCAAILSTAAAVWLLARKNFGQKGSRSEIKLLLASMAGTAIWLIITVLVVIQFHVWLGGSL